jgi:hypothetical protein
MLAREEEAWSALSREVDRLAPERRRTEGVVPGWSADDLVWHCAKWAEFAAERLAALDDGPFVDPFDSEPDEHWDAESARFAEQSKSMDTGEIDAAAASIRQHVRGVWASLPDLGPEADTWFAEETFVHYDEHAAEVRRFADEA